MDGIWFFFGNSQKRDQHDKSVEVFFRINF